ncbi:hypothetical protein GCM10025876_13550 [Demequina litorisediminis]|uniref:Lysine--tRNA ligase n=1 Tax=Demequina litorisediminis TaxID=1849022 RepID=A0ABQ6ICJ5_9MICO|nr:hypothetical protein GCM10025876_13550 [Demequina litorisediminis]
MSGSVSVQSEAGGGERGAEGCARRSRSRAGNLEGVTDVTDAPVADDLPEQMKVRRAKRDRLIAEGGQAYPVSVDRTHEIADVKAAYADLEDGQETDDVVAVAGRVVFVRNTGKALLRDRPGWRR